MRPDDGAAVVFAKVVFAKVVFATVVFDIGIKS